MKLAHQSSVSLIHFTLGGFRKSRRGDDDGASQAGDRSYRIWILCWILHDRMVVVCMWKHNSEVLRRNKQLYCGRLNNMRERQNAVCYEASTTVSTDREKSQLDVCEKISCAYGKSSCTISALIVYYKQNISSHKKNNFHCLLRTCRTRTNNSTWLEPKVRWNWIIINWKWQETRGDIVNMAQNFQNFPNTQVHIPCVALCSSDNQILRNIPLEHPCSGASRFYGPFYLFFCS